MRHTEADDAVPSVAAAEFSGSGIRSVSRQGPGSVEAKTGKLLWRMRGLPRVPRVWSMMLVSDSMF